MDKSAMFKIGYGLYVLTAREGDKDNGCIVNTLMQVTQNPLSVVLGVNKANYTHDMIVNTGRFQVSVLTDDAPFSLFERFGFQSGRGADKFMGFADVARSESGLIYITRHSNAYLYCEVADSADFGTHTLFTARVSDAETLGEGRSVTYADYHARIKPAPAKRKSGYRCRICGYVYEGDELPEDFICPICKHGASDFERITL